MADAGVGVSLGDATTQRLIGVYMGAIGSFMVLFVAMMWKQSNEVLIARR